MSSAEATIAPSEDKSLTDTLADMGLTHRKRPDDGAYDPHEICKGETVVARLTASNTWAAIKDGSLVEAVSRLAA